MSAMVTSKWLVVLLAGALGALAGGAGADPNWKQNGNSRATKAEQCVRPTDEVRRYHMSLLKHQRDITVHQGVRQTADALAGCVDCHANKDLAGKFVPVNAEGQFCSACHAFAAVQLDCFQCHTTVPAGK